MGGIVSCCPCCRCEIGDLLNRPVGKSGQDLVQVFANRDPEAAAAFNHGEYRGHTRSGLWTADVDPVLTAQGYAAHGVFRQVVAKFQFRIFEEAGQFLPQLDRVGARLPWRALRPHLLTQPKDKSVDVVAPGWTPLFAPPPKPCVTHLPVPSSGVNGT